MNATSNLTCHRCGTAVEKRRVVVAKPKVGKSTLARCLALAVARGEDFLGRKTTQGPVFYLALEETFRSARALSRNGRTGGRSDLHLLRYGAEGQDRPRRCTPWLDWAVWLLSILCLS